MTQKQRVVVLVSWIQGIPGEHGIEDEVWQHFHEITCPVADLQVSLEVEGLEHSRIPDLSACNS